MNSTDQTERLHPSMVQAIAEAMRRHKIKQADVAKAVGLGKPWVSKLLSGKTKTIRFEHLELLCDFLHLNDTPSTAPAKELSPTAQRIGKIIDSDAAGMRFAQALEEMLTNQCLVGIPFIPTQEMGRIGREVIRICDADRDRPGKVAREVLMMLSAEIEKSRGPYCRPTTPHAEPS